MLAELAEFQFNTLKALEGVVATIARGADATEPTTVVLGRVDSQATTTREATYTANAQDILILDSDYRPTGQPSEPQDGDVITLTQRGFVITLEARPPDENQACFQRWKGGAVFRVHTKIQSREPV